MTCFADLTIEKIADRAFWEGLGGGLPITDHPFAYADPPLALPPAEQERIRQTMTRDAYFCTGPVLDAALYEPVRDMAWRLHAAQIPPVFAGVYDPVWRLARLLSDTLLAPYLGEDYLPESDYWVWHVPMGRGHSGWPEHRDMLLDEYIDPNGDLQALSVWIPLTDVSRDNACMNVVPRRFDVNYQKMLAGGGVDYDHVYRREHVRALPAKAGSLMGWDPHLLHWGGPSTDRAANPRTSLGFYFRRRSCPSWVFPYRADGTKDIEPRDRDARLTFDERLTIIANNIDFFHTKEFAPPDQKPFWLDFAKRLKTRPDRTS